MGTTTNYSITYPASTDLVSGGATAMQTLATNTDTALNAQIGQAWGRNWIDNPTGELNFRNAQSSYVADRWYKNSASVTATSTRTAVTAGTTGLPFFVVWSLTNSITVNSSATASIYDMEQFIDDVRALAGQTVKISFYAKASSALKVGVAVDQHFGTGGAPSATVNNPATLVTLSTSWTRYTVSFAVPSISGKTLGTNNDSASFLRFYMSAGSNFSVQASSIGLQTGTWDITGVQLEMGYVTPFEQRPRFVEENRCARYFETSYAEGRYLSAGGTYTNEPEAVEFVAGSDNSGFYYWSALHVQPKRYATGLALQLFAGTDNTLGNTWFSAGATNGTKATTSNLLGTRRWELKNSVAIAANTTTLLKFHYAVFFNTAGIYL